MMEFFRSMAYGTAEADAAEARKDALNTKVGDLDERQEVDTCLAFDTHQWETGIKRDGTWVVVEKYDDKDAAVLGHDKWVAALAVDPTMALTEVGFDSWPG